MASGFGRLCKGLLVAGPLFFALSMKSWAQGDGKIFPDLHMVVKFPTTVQVNGQPPGPRRTLIDLSVTLTNSSTQPIHLTSGGCVHVYDILDASSNKVVLPFPEMCSAILKMHDLAPGKSFSDKHKVSIDGTKLKDGGKYILRYAFWGVKTGGDVPFTAKVLQ